jgi:hypothetical protein
METGILHLHSLLRWVALVVIIVAIVRSYKGMTQRLSFTKKDDRWSLFTLITFHLQLVIGLALYFINGWYRFLGEMSDPILRFYSLEHLVAMLIAIALVTIGRVKGKKANTDKLRHQRQFWYFLFALILVLINIPWPFREVGAGRGWLPGM